MNVCMGEMDDLRLFEFECNKLTSSLAGVGYGASKTNSSFKTPRNNCESGPDGVTLSPE